MFYAPYLSVLPEGVDEGLSDRGFATAEAVSIGAALLDGNDPGHHPDDRLYGVRIGPGIVQLLTTGTIGDTHAGQDHGETPRGEITEWSGKSRANMVRTLCQLDWSPVVDAGAGWRPAMITLTLPGDWESLTPTGDEFKAMLRAFFKRWERAFGTPWRGVWKLEFQRRGAPHVHLYCPVPVGQVVTEDGRGSGGPQTLSEPFWRAGRGNCWLARTWYEIVGSGDPRHLRAGTAVDWSEGVRASDPKRVGIYFATKATRHNVGAAKEYQHQVPELWHGEGRGPGRFWGYRQLQRATVDVLLTREDWLQLRRMARRWARAQGRPVSSLEVGRIAGGFLLVNDGPGWIAQAARSPTLRGPPGWQTGRRQDTRPGGR